MAPVALRRMPSPHAIGLAQLVAWGVTLYAIPPLLPRIMHDVALSATSLSLAMTVGLLISAFGSVAVGTWIQRYGARAPMVGGTLVATLALFGMATSSSPAGVLVGLTALCMTSATLLYEPAFAAIGTQVRDPILRVRAIQIITFWGGWAALWSIPTATYLSEAWNWRVALLVLAGVLLAQTLPVHLRLPPGSPHARARRSEAICTTGLPRRLGAGFALGACAIGIVVVHGILLLESRGVDVGTASISFALMAPVQIAGRIWFLRRKGRLQRGDAILPLLLVAGGLLAMLAVPTLLALVLFVVLFAAGAGLLTTVRAALVATLVPPDRFATEVGAMSFIISLARGASPVVGASTHLLLGFHGAVLVVIALVLAGAALVSSGARAARLREACRLRGGCSIVPEC